MLHILERFENRTQWSWLVTVLDYSQSIQEWRVYQLSIVFLALSLGIVFYTLEVTIGKVKTLQSILYLSFVVVGVGWIGVRNPIILWSIRTLILVFLATAIYKFKPKRHLIGAVYKSGYLLALGLLTSIIPTKVIFYLFAAGYDNSSHLGFLYRTWKIGSYEYGLQGNGKIVPTYSNLANSYPSLQMESWAAILHTLNMSIYNSESLIRFFFFFSILSIMLFLYVLFSFVNAPIKQKIFLKLGILGFVLFSSLSSIFWMGFPPTVWGVLFAILSLKIMISTTNKPIDQLLQASISFVVILYAYQLFAPAFLALYAYLFFEIVKNSRKKKDYILIIASLLLVVIPTYLLLRVSSRIKSVTFIYAQGGIHFPSIVLVVVLVVLALLGFIYSDKKSKGNRVIVITIIVNSLLTVYLIGSGILLKKGIYYPVKSLYLTIFMLIAYLVWSASETQKRTNSSFRAFGRIIIMVLLGFALLPLCSQNRGIWYGNSTDIIRSVKLLNTGSYPPFPPNCLEEVFNFATQSENFDKQSNLIAIRVDAGQYGNLSDLVSRWANSLNGRIDENIIGLGMRLNAENDFDASILSFRKANPSENMLIQDSLPGCAKAN